MMNAASRRTGDRPRSFVRAAALAATALVAAGAASSVQGADVTRDDIALGCPGTNGSGPQRAGYFGQRMNIYVVDQNRCLLDVKYSLVLQFTDGQRYAEQCPSYDCPSPYFGGDLPTLNPRNKPGILWLKLTVKAARYRDYIKRGYVYFGRCTTTTRFPVRYTRPGNYFIRYRCR